MIDVRDFCLDGTATVADAIELMGRNQQGLAIVVDEHRRLIATVTDGDLRRAFYRRCDPTDLVLSVLPHVKHESRREPLAAPLGTPPSELLALLETHSLRHLPLLDAHGGVVDVAFRTDLERRPERNVQAVIMAGGMGTRLRPLTNDTPKPMLSVGDKPLLEHLVGQIRDSGIHQVHLTTHYRPEKIQEHFGDGETFGINIAYVPETEPLGTAGALRLLKERREHILVVNGDILTNVNFRSMMEYHEDQHAGITVAVVTYDVPVPFGVVEIDGRLVTRISEKPVFQYFVNAGIYVVSADVIDVMPPEGRCDMTELIQLLLARNMPVVPFPITEYWLDIGSVEDFEAAQKDVSTGRFKDHMRQRS